MGNDNCCSSRLREAHFLDKKQRNCIYRLFRTISDSNKGGKTRNVIEREHFAEYIFEAETIQKVLTEQLFGAKNTASLEEFTAFCTSLVVNEGKEFHYENLIKKSKKYYGIRNKDEEDWKQRDASKELAGKLLQEVYQIMEITDFSKKTYSVPDSSLILSPFAGKRLSWMELFSFIEEKFPLINKVLQSYFDFKFLGKLIPYGFPEITQKTMAFDSNICAGIALTHEDLLTKVTVFDRLFSSGELNFDFTAFTNSLTNQQKNSGVLILMKFLCNDQPGTHHQQVVGCLLPKGFQSQEVQLQKDQECILFEIQPCFKPIFQQRTENTLKLSEKGFGIGFNSKTQKHRIWIDKNMFTNSYVTSQDDFFKDGFESFESNILIHLETWGFEQEKQRLTQQHVDSQDINFLQFLQHKNYLEIFSTCQDGSNYSLSYRFQSDDVSHNRMTLLNSKNGSLGLNQSQLDPSSTLKQSKQLYPQRSLKLNVDDRRQRALQLFGDGSTHINTHNYAGRVTEGNQKAEVKSERLLGIKEKYKDMSKRIDRSQSDCEAIFHNIRSFNESSGKKQYQQEQNDNNNDSEEEQEEPRNSIKKNKNDKPKEGDNYENNGKESTFDKILQFGVKILQDSTKQKEERNKDTDNH